MARLTTEEMIMDYIRKQTSDTARRLQLAILFLALLTMAVCAVLSTIPPATDEETFLKENECLFQYSELHVTTTLNAASLPVKSKYVYACKTIGLYVVVK